MGPGRGPQRRITTSRCGWQLTVGFGWALSDAVRRWRLVQRDPQPRPRTPHPTPAVRVIPLAAPHRPRPHARRTSPPPPPPTPRPSPPPARPPPLPIACLPATQEWTAEEVANGLHQGSMNFAMESRSQRGYKHRMVAPDASSSSSSGSRPSSPVKVKPAESPVSPAVLPAVAEADGDVKP